MRQNLISLWHFDENSRHLAISAPPSCNPLFIHGAVHRSRRFGQALELRLPGDRVTGDGPGRLLCDSVCFWVAVSGVPVKTVDPPLLASFSVYTNDISDGAFHAAAMTNEQSVSRCLRGLGAFD